MSGGDTLACSRHLSAVECAYVEHAVIRPDKQAVDSNCKPSWSISRKSARPTRLLRHFSVLRAGKRSIAVEVMPAGNPCIRKLAICQGDARDLEGASCSNLLYCNKRDPSLGRVTLNCSPASKAIHHGGARHVYTSTLTCSARPLFSHCILQHSHYRIVSQCFPQSIKS